MSWTFPKKSAVMLTLSLKNYAEKIHRTDSDTSAMVSQILLNTSKHPTSPSDLRTCHTKKTLALATRVREIKLKSFLTLGWRIESQLFQHCSPAFKEKKNTEAWTTDIVCQIIIFLLFFVNYLSTTNNNYGLSISKACTSE